MADILKKLSEQQENFQEAFGNIFNKNQESQYIQKNANGTGYYLNGNPVGQFVTDGSLYPYSDEAWTQKETIWLLNGKFNATTIHIKNGEVSLSGEWNDGAFSGHEFFGNMSSFNGGTFHGEIYSAPNESFTTTADNYYTGKFIKNKNGVIGVNNLTQEVKNDADSIAVISIPLDWTVSIVDEKNQKITFQIIKRIDEVSTNFTIMTLPKRQKINIPWEVIRGNYINNGFITKGRPFTLFTSNGFGNVTKIEIKQESPTTVDFSVHKNLGKFLRLKNQNVAFDVQPSSSESKIFISQFLKDLPEANGKFYRILSDLKMKIKNGQIKGHSGFNYLHTVFNDIPGEKITDKDTVDEMQYIDNVIKYIGGDSVKIEVGDKKINIQKRLISAMKTYLGINKAFKPLLDDKSGDGSGVGKSSDEKKQDFIDDTMQDYAKQNPIKQ